MSIIFWAILSISFFFLFNHFPQNESKHPALEKLYRAIHIPLQSNDLILRGVQSYGTYTREVTAELNVDRMGFAKTLIKLVTYCPKVIYLKFTGRYDENLMQVFIQAMISLQSTSRTSWNLKELPARDTIRNRLDYLSMGLLYSRTVQKIEIDDG